LQRDKIYTDDAEETAEYQPEPKRKPVHNCTERKQSKKHAAEKRRPERQVKVRRKNGKQGREYQYQAG
jgi:hypothetical protein